jgi:hypothetical protein
MARTLRALLVRVRRRRRRQIELLVWEMAEMEQVGQGTDRGCRASALWVVS